MRKNSTVKSNSWILHVDGDGFFASCENAAHPELRGKPVVVGKERGIAMAMTPEAKKLGITRAMPIFRIKRFFPEVTILPSHFEIYGMYSDKMHRVLKRFLSTIEKYSIDECFAEVSYNEWSPYGSIENFAQVVKQTLQRDTGLTFSVGIARTKVLTKIASNWQKPDGLTIIYPEDEGKFLEGTEIGDIWGIGHRMAPKFRAKGITTAFAFASLEEEYVEKQFNKPLVELWQELRGVRCHSVGSNLDHQKSIQATLTFSPASDDPRKVLSELTKNIETACERLREDGLISRAGSFYLKTAEFRYVGIEFHLPLYTSDPRDFIKIVTPLFAKIFKVGTRYRASGVTLSGLISEENCLYDLFGTQEDKLVEDHKIYGTVDNIKEKFGSQAIFLAGSLQAMDRRRVDQKKYHGGESYVYNLPFPYLGEAS